MSRRRLARISRGFTLIEVLIAATILAAMGALVFGSFQRAYKQKEELEKADERYQQVRAAMDRMALEISQAFISENYDRNRYRERPTLFKGEDKELLFTSLSNERLEADSKTSDQAVIRYIVDRDTENIRIQSLFRRVNPIIDEEAERRGARTVICENVKEIRFAYWDAMKNEWVDEWDAARPEHMGVLPERVRIQLTAIDEEGKEKKFTTQSRIMLQRSLDFR